MDHGDDRITVIAGSKTGLVQPFFPEIEHIDSPSESHSVKSSSGKTNGRLALVNRIRRSGGAWRFDHVPTPCRPVLTAHAQEIGPWTIHARISAR
jgi:hypothetical protein